MKYIGFDFGDGTTVASVYDSDTRELEIINILKGDREIPSYLAKDGANTYIGQFAANHTHFYAYWKERPSVRESSSKIYTWEERRNLTIEFMKKVLEETKLQNPDVFSNENDCRYIIGIPSGWNEDDENIYRDWAVKAGLNNVKTVRESQAAILYARKNADSPKPSVLQKALQSAFTQGIIMIDLGSSTTDFTYIKGLGIPKNYGINLGAHEIERLLLENYKETAVNAYPYTDESMEKLHMAQNFRPTKEDVFSQFASPTVLAAKGFSNLEYVDGEQYVVSCGEREARGYTITRNWLEKVMEKKFSLPGTTESKCWREHFGDALRRFFGDNKISTENLTVLVTGGASRMYFVEEYIRSILGSVTIIKSNDNLCSESVAMGLAWAGYANDEFQNVLSDWNTKKIYDYFYSNTDFKNAVLRTLKNVLEHHDISQQIRQRLSDCNNSVVNHINRENDNTLSPDDVKKFYFEELAKSIKDLFKKNAAFISKGVILPIENDNTLVGNFWREQRKNFGASYIEFECPSIDECFNFTALSDHNFDWTEFFISLFPSVLLAKIWIFISDCFPKSRVSLVKKFHSYIAISYDTLLNMCQNTVNNQLANSIFSKVCEGISNNRRDELFAIFAIFSDKETTSDNSQIKYIEISEKCEGYSFEMTVSDSCIFSENGSCVVTGKILCGCICKNDVVDIIDSDNGEMQRLKVLAIEINGKTVDKAESGTRCGLLLNGGADKKMIGKKIVKR